MAKKIALEEHFLSPGLAEYWMPTVAEIDPAIATRLYSRLNDFGEQRLKAMDGAGIEHAVLSIAGPGVQAERDTATATRRARESNDFLAREIHKRPEHYSGFAHLAMQDPRAAANELERCIREFGFAGAMINGHTNGHYLDESALDPFWERAAELGVPIYLHPADPVVPAPVLDGLPALRRATWEWGFETGSHALRLVFGGVFDRFPKARIVLGHLGETLPYLLWRFDSRAKLYGVRWPAAIALYQDEHADHLSGYVRDRALILRHRGARRRSRDVRRRLSVREFGRSRQVHGQRAARRRRAGGYRLSQC